jgi:hypothetical protein
MLCVSAAAWLRPNADYGSVPVFSGSDFLFEFRTDFVGFSIGYYIMEGTRWTVLYTHGGFFDWASS